MRISLLVLAGAASLACAPAPEPLVDTGTVAPPPGQVMVDARCAGPRNTSVTVSPWNLHVPRDSNVTITWVINAAANTDTITITPKQGTSWPFDGASAVGSKAAPAQVQGRTPNTPGVRYRYNIQLVCQVGSADPDTVVVDPDIIVD